MRVLVTAFVVLVTAFVVFLMTQSSARAVDWNDYYAVWHDRRIVRGSVRFRFDQIYPAKDQSWLITDVVPATHSGKVRGVDRDATGKPINLPPPGTKAVKVIEGSLQNTVILDGEDTSEESYHWEVFGTWTGDVVQFSTPSASRNAKVTTERDVYSSFVKGGTIVCKVYMKLEGSHRFSPVYLVPDDWRDFITPALKHHRENITLFRSRFPADQEDERKRNDALLRGLLLHSNPFIAIDAARTISHATGLDETFVKEYLAQTTGFRQAVFTSFVLQQFEGPREQEAQSAITAIEALIDNARSADKLKWIALGAYAAAGDTLDFSPIQEETLSPVEKQSLALLKRINEKQTLFKTATPEDKYIDTLLTMTGLRRK